jgi:4-aminobutyrate aminotransferase-like enzyme
MASDVDPDGTRSAAVSDPPLDGKHGDATGTWRERLRAHEPRGFTATGGGGPLIWERAAGCEVEDVDGRIYTDLTAAFGVAAIGHAHPRVVEAVRHQAGRLLHAMADLHPARVKIELLEALAAVAPGDLDAAYLGLSGADAVDAALKIALLVTGRPRVVHLGGSYHGLSHGALAVCGRPAFRDPFAPQIAACGIEAPFPITPAEIDVITQLIALDDVGAVIVEPLQGRAGVRQPAPGFLPALRAACDRHGVLLVADEIFTGLGRTGRWFAVEHDDVVPDLLLVGKSLGGGLPLSACIGRRRQLGDWDAGGESLHTQTFSGHPLASAAALAVLGVLRDERLVERAAALGAGALEQLRTRLEGRPGIAAVRGRGLLAGIECRRPDDGGSDADRVGRVLGAARERGLILGLGGAGGEVLVLSPPLTIERQRLESGLGLVCDLLEALPPGTAP